jgi:hypothetical protein
MVFEIVNLTHGDTWTPTIMLFSDEEKTTAFDATGYVMKCHIKVKLEEDATEILVLNGVWTTQDEGIGYVNMTHAQSLNLRVKDYYFQIKIYVAVDNSVVKTPKQGVLRVIETLEKDIPD